MTYAWGNIWRLPITRPTAAALRRSGILTVFLFGAGVLGFSAAVVGVEVLQGWPLIAPATPGFSHSLADALWHLLSALAIALPARRWAVAWLGPVLALGLDVDHLFGGILPTVTMRTAHDLLLVVLLAAALYWVQGRSAGFLAAGAILAHIAVDGGAFPLLGPFTVATFVLPFAASVVLFVAAAVLFFLAGREARELLRPFPLLLVAIACAVALSAFAYLPLLSSFVGQ